MASNDFYTITEEQFGNDLAYQFTTDGDLAYTVGVEANSFDQFFESGSVLEENSWAIIFISRPFNEDANFSQDDKVSYTIIKIVESFLQDNPDSVLIYHCDSEDQRQNARQILYGRWAMRSDNGLSINHEQTTIVQPLEGNLTKEHHLGYFVKSGNPRLNEINAEYLTFCKLFTDALVHKEDAHQDTPAGNSSPKVEGISTTDRKVTPKQEAD